CEETQTSANLEVRRARRLDIRAGGVRKLECRCSPVFDPLHQSVEPECNDRPEHEANADAWTHREIRHPVEALRADSASDEELMHPDRDVEIQTRGNGLGARVTRGAWRLVGKRRVARVTLQFHSRMQKHPESSPEGAGSTGKVPSLVKTRELAKATDL